MCENFKEKLLKLKKVVNESNQILKNRKLNIKKHSELLKKYIPTPPTTINPKIKNRYAYGKRTYIVPKYSLVL